MARATKNVEVGVSREKLFKIITDYEAYPEFLTTVKGAKIIKRTKSSTQVEFEAKILRPFRYTLELTERSPASISWKLLDGDFMRKNSGCWKLRAIDSNRTEAAYEIDVELSKLVPSFLVKTLVDESLPETLAAFRDRAEAIAKKRTKKSTSA